MSESDKSLNISDVSKYEQKKKLNTFKLDIVIFRRVCVCMMPFECISNAIWQANIFISFESFDQMQNEKESKKKAFHRIATAAYLELQFFVTSFSCIVWKMTRKANDGFLFLRQIELRSHIKITMYQIAGHQCQLHASTIKT